MWEYTDQSVCYPQGIAVDEDSNVYIASNGNNDITVLSSNGNHAKKLLDKDNGIDKPFGLAFDVKKGKLVVANYSNPALYALY